MVTKATWLPGVEVPIKNVKQLMKKYAIKVLLALILEYLQSNIQRLLRA